MKVVLSVQSYVTSGYVGNRVAVRILEMLGYSVDAINSVTFSNHTRHKYLSGTKASAEDLEEILNGLEKNGLASYDFILTGYIGSFDFLKKLHEYIEKIKIKSPETKFLCDPVLGDNGHMYVPQEFTEFYTNNMLKNASFITPNQFEAEIMSKTKIETQDDAIFALRYLHQKGPMVVIITSVKLKEENEFLTCFFGIKENSSNFNAYSICFKRYDADFVGTGDLFSSLFLGFYGKGHDIIDCIQRTLYIVSEILVETYKNYKKPIHPPPSFFRQNELALSNCIDLIISDYFVSFKLNDLGLQKINDE